MNFQAILGELLGAGQELTQLVSDKTQGLVGVPESGEQKHAMLSGLGKGAVATAVLGLLLGTKTGRSIGKSAVKMGGLAALGGVAYNAYQNWKESQPENQINRYEAVASRSSESIEQNSKTILRAMLMAAKADGNIDEHEQKIVLQTLRQVDEGAQAWMQSELGADVSPILLADEIGNDTALATEVYLASRMVMGDVSRHEQKYLNDLADALQIPISLVEKIEFEAEKA